MLEQWGIDSSSNSSVFWTFLRSTIVLYLSSPFEHGEVFVLDDGGEVDLDLGNYERFVDITTTRDHNITTGKIYHNVIEKVFFFNFVSTTYDSTKSFSRNLNDD